MAVFGVKTPENEDLDKCVNSIRVRLMGENLVLNPFRGSIRRMNGVYVFNMTPVYPNFTWAGWLSLLATFYFSGWTWWLLPSLVLVGLGFFWSSYFFYLMFRLALRKDKIRIDTKMLTGSRLIEEVLF